MPARGDFKDMTPCGSNRGGAAFARAFSVLCTRINLLLALPMEKLERSALRRQLDAIGKTGSEGNPA